MIPADIGVTPSFCQDKKKPVYGLECRFYCKKYGFRPVRDFPPITCESDGTWSVDLNTISFQCEGNFSFDKGNNSDSVTEMATKIT